jgi:hypothetical protein
MVVQVVVVMEMVLQLHPLVQETLEVLHQVEGNNGGASGGLLVGNGMLAAVVVVPGAVGHSMVHDSWRWR